MWLNTRDIVHSLISCHKNCPVVKTVVLQDACTDNADNLPGGSSSSGRWRQRPRLQYFEWCSVFMTLRSEIRDNDTTVARAIDVVAALSCYHQHDAT